MVRDVKPKATTIVDALKGDYLPHLRVSTGERWLVWDEGLGLWVVYSRGYRQRFTRTVGQTPDEAEAIRYLLEDGI